LARVSGVLLSINKAIPLALPHAAFIASSKFEDCVSVSDFDSVLSPRFIANLTSPLAASGFVFLIFPISV
jgi:cellulose synthase/poly-beta-1,6-N-acetylglucosamine synthase-like glycosyltransferase